MGIRCVLHPLGEAFILVTHDWGEATTVSGRIRIRPDKRAVDGIRAHISRVTGRGDPQDVSVRLGPLQVRTTSTTRIGDGSQVRIEPLPRHPRIPAD